MKRLAIALLLIASFTSAFAQDFDAKRQIGMASVAVGKAIESSDFAALEKLWSPGFVVNSPANRVIGRDEVFAAIKRGGTKHRDNLGQRVGCREGTLAKGLRIVNLESPARAFLFDRPGQSSFRKMTESRSSFSLLVNSV